MGFFLFFTCEGVAGESVEEAMDWWFLDRKLSILWWYYEWYGNARELLKL
jgi:hypothetical protein